VLRCAFVCKLEFCSPDGWFAVLRASDKTRYYLALHSFPFSFFLINKRVAVLGTVVAVLGTVVKGCKGGRPGYSGQIIISFKVAGLYPPGDVSSWLMYPLG